MFEIHPRDTSIGRGRLRAFAHDWRARHVNRPFARGDARGRGGIALMRWVGI